MNIFVRFGQWLDKRRVLRQPDMDALTYVMESVEKSIRSYVEEKQQYNVGRFETLSAEKQIPATLAKDLAVIRSRIDRLELLTGLKREQQPVKVPGAAAIS